jgi:hypothetical protein
LREVAGAVVGANEKSPDIRLAQRAVVAALYRGTDRNGDFFTVDKALGRRKDERRADAS